MFNYKDLAAAVIMVGRNGAEMICSDHDGEVIWALGLAPGQYDARQYQALMGASDVITLDGATLIQRQPNRLQRISMGEVANQSGANPDWRPPAGTEALLRDMQRKMAALDKRNTALEKRAEMLAAVAAKKAERDAQEAEAAAKAAQEAEAAAKAAQEAAQLAETQSVTPDA